MTRAGCPPCRTRRRGRTRARRRVARSREDLAERVGHPAGRAVIQLQRDRPLRRSKVLPQPGVGAVAVQHHFDAVAGVSHAPVSIVAISGNSGSATPTDAPSADAADVTNRCPARDLEKTDQCESEDDGAHCSATDSAEDGDHSVRVRVCGCLTPSSACSTPSLRRRIVQPHDSSWLPSQRSKGVAL